MDYKSDYETLLEMAKIPFPKARRLQNIAVQVYKIINEMPPVYLHKLIQSRNNVTNLRSGHTSV